MTTEYEYHVDPQHSTVLDCPASCGHGARYWSELDWSYAFKVSGRHVFNVHGGEYLHVRVQHDPRHDGPIKECPPAMRRQYRVRCRRAIGTKWRGGIVKDVRVEGCIDDGWKWIVTVEEVAE